MRMTTVLRKVLLTDVAYGQEFFLNSWKFVRVHSAGDDRPHIETEWREKKGAPGWYTAEEAGLALHDYNWAACENTFKGVTTRMRIMRSIFVYIKVSVPVRRVA